MFAVIKTGGKQYSVESGKTLKVERIDGEKGKSLFFDKVLAISDSSKHVFGTPLIEGAAVQAGAMAFQTLPALKEKLKQEWGRLPPKLAKDLMDGRREAVSGEYRERVETYFRAMAEKARQKKINK